MSHPLEELDIQIYADGADKTSMVELAKNPIIKGFTTNPTLMRKAGVTDYAAFAKEVLAEIKDKPVSFEVFSDDFAEMERQGRIIASWAPNVYVKIPITNTKKASAYDLVAKFAKDGIKMNITAILTANQVRHIVKALSPKVPAIISVFAGRVADSGVDPIPLMQECAAILADYPKFALLWASPREVFNMHQAAFAGAKIITVSPEILKKAEMLGIDHEELSLQTVKMFYDDGQKVGYTLY